MAMTCSSLYPISSTAPDKPDALLIPCLVETGLKSLAMGAHVHVEDGTRQGGIMFFRNDGLLDGVHAAHGRAVGIVALVDVPGAHALQPGDVTGLGPVGQAGDMALFRAGCRQQPFEFQGGHHILELVPYVHRRITGMLGLEPGSQNHGPHLQGNSFIRILKIDGTGGAHFFANAAPVFGQLDAVHWIDDIFDLKR